MKIINNIDLWTERCDNHYDCFNGAFVDGFDGDNIPFDRYKIVKNCNCIITSDWNINIRNKHQAMIFYKGETPVRLVVINKDTNIDKCIKIALSQDFGNGKLIDIYKRYNITGIEVDLKQKPIINNCDKEKEIDVGSCDRWPLLYSMLNGSYTESETSYGNFEINDYEFVRSLFLKYELITDEEEFEIVHECAFMNTKGTQIIPLQEKKAEINIMKKR